MTEQNTSLSSNYKLLRSFEVVFLALIGAVVAAYAIKDTVYYVSDFIWRSSKGYLSWDEELFMSAYIFSMAMLATLFFILARALYRGRWTRRTAFWILGVSVAGIVAFVLCFKLLLAGGFLEGF